MSKVEFFFDVSSPWTYLAFRGLTSLCAELGVDIVWKPILVGGVFNAVNPAIYEHREKPVAVKKSYEQKDRADWVRYYGMESVLKPGVPPVFPVNSVKAMRGAFVAIEAGQIVPYAERLFAAYWGEHKDISQDDVLGAAVSAVGMDRKAFFEKIATQPYKDKLRNTTDELIKRGGYGSPTMYLDGSDMFFGNDRLFLLRAAILRKQR
ncbi:MAG: 2-hydroxychromene-2-carboxylate isomerase [Alphaproteobacteria bacterium]